MRHCRRWSPGVPFRQTEMTESEQSRISRIDMEFPYISRANSLTRNEDQTLRSYCVRLSWHPSRGETSGTSVRCVRLPPPETRPQQKRTGRSESAGFLRIGHEDDRPPPHETSRLR